MIFQNPENLLLSLLLIVFIPLLLIDRNLLFKFIKSQFSTNTILLKKANRRWYYSSISLLISFFSMVIALASPAFSETTILDSRTGTNVIFNFDLSKSMEAEDSPPNRLERAKIILSNLTKELSNPLIDNSFDEASIILTRGISVLALPNTSDKSLVQNTISTIQRNYVQQAGGNINSAFPLVLESYEEMKNKHIIFIIASDGSDLDYKEFSSQLHKTSSLGIKTVILGLGGNSLFEQSSNGSHYSSKQEFPLHLAEFPSNNFEYINASSSTIDELVQKLKTLILQESKSYYKSIPASIKNIFILLALFFMGIGLYERPIKWRNA